MTFKIGDTVEYRASGKHGRPEWNGSVGEILDNWGGDQRIVLWKSGKAFSDLIENKNSPRPCHYIQNLKIFEVEIKYDPKQQPDEEDDI